MDSFRPGRRQENAAEGGAAIPPPSENGDLAEAPISDAVARAPLKDKGAVRVNPELTTTDFVKGTRPGDVFVLELRRHEILLQLR